MSNEDIEARAKAATPGPWTPSTILRLALKEDVEFAAHAREDIPCLLAQLEAAEKRWDTLAAREFDAILEGSE